MKTAFFTERQLFIIGSALVLIGLLLNLGVQPLYLEEPRRIMIAIEMAENGQYIAPTELGDFYYKKPPVFNWLLLLSTAVFGGYTEFAFRMPTVLSTIGMGLVIWWFAKPYLGSRNAWITGLLFVISSGIFFYFSLLAEIDIFYSLVTLVSLFCLFHYYQKQQYWAAFILTYLFGAIGALTKGPPSVLFLGFTIVGYLLWKRDWKRLFSLPHISGGLLFLAIFGGYLYAYSFYNPVPYFLQGLWGQSSEMTVLERPSVADLILHFFTFPLSYVGRYFTGCVIACFCHPPWYLEGSESQ
jgi:4-amino-4-deoxy-L-arabinose transferase-like glycosyltransferase